ncbi:MAG: glycosyltransferase [Novosphingobium sp.]
MPQAKTAPAISVLMPAYNAQAFIRQSVQSVLSQTYEDFELIVVNDGSTDDTAALLAAIDDPRLRIIDNPRNLGIVGTLNHGMQHARGHYIARMDADDFSLPQRFARQKAFLDSHPDTVIVASEMMLLEDGNVTFTREGGDPDPAIVEWLLHLGNPVGHTSMMFRAATVAAMGTYLREDFTYAEDFDFSHRMLRHGQISVLPEHLVIYRKHLTNLTRTKRATMIERTARVLREAYVRLLGPGSETDADTVTAHLIARAPFEDDAAVLRLAQFLPRLMEGFAESRQTSIARRTRMQEVTDRAWWRMIQAVLRGGQAGIALRHRNAFATATRPPVRDILRAAAAGFATTHLRMARPKRRPNTLSHQAQTIGGAEFYPVPPPTDDPPSLYIVVDTEAEFDWNKEFDRTQTAVSAMRQQQPVQRIFDSWGVRPIYVVDYAVASQPDGYGPLREILDRHGCVIGAHMHAWITPPFEETVSEYNSFGGNLPRDLEERKLRALIAAIEQNFDITPLFFRAGRYGVGPNTMDLLEKLGFLVDFSLLPHADLRARGGPDFRFAECVPYRTAGGGLLSVPMTRGQIGAIAPMSPRLQGLLQHRVASRLRLQGILSRMKLANTVTLTPEGVSTAEQIQLIDAMISRGCRSFALHYHSPTLAKQTPYVRNEADLADFIGRIEAVCRHFFDVRGGLPGNPADLLPPGQRSRLWPAEALSRVAEPLAL